MTSSPNERLHIAIISAGGAGMFCGACMHDNTWAKSLMQAGADVSLLPTYTPLRVDEPNQSQRRIFLGGINLYLEYKYPLWQRIPRWAKSWLDAPWVIRLATNFSVSNDAGDLGPLAMALLQGSHGPQRAEVDELVRFVTGQLRPDIIVFSNALLSGVLPALREHFEGPIVCTLQGDDVFLDSLPEPYRRPVLDRVSSLARGFDGFVTHTRFYQKYIASYLGLPEEKFRQIPLGIDVTGCGGRPEDLARNTAPTVGFFARLAPEKGFHHLLDAFTLLHRRRPDVRLRFGGYRDHREQYPRDVLQRVATFGAACEDVGSPETHARKVDFYRSVDVLSVPTEFEEPKGLYVLEALANGRPVVQPAHGAFPEVIHNTGGGLLVPPRDPAALADGLESLINNRDRRVELARQGWSAVREKYSLETMATETLRLFTEWIEDKSRSTSAQLAG